VGRGKNLLCARVFESKMAYLLFPLLFFAGSQVVERAVCRLAFFGFRVLIVAAPAAVRPDCAERPACVAEFSEDCYGGCFLLGGGGLGGYLCLVEP